MPETLALLAAPPSREANPFATCWTHPGALPAMLAPGETLDGIVARLERCGWRGQITGPHGAGKSTLLAHLAETVETSDRSVATVRLDRPSGSRRLAALLAESPPTFVVLEGFERLSPLARRGALRRCRLSGAGWLAPTHRRVVAWPERLPVVARLSPTAETLLSLFERLTLDRPSPVTPHDALASFAHRRGDLRTVWFDLYDLHERATRRGRTKTVLVS